MVVIVLPNVFTLSIKEITSVALVLVFIITPLGNSLNFISKYTAAIVSLSQITHIENSFNESLQIHEIIKHSDKFNNSYNDDSLITIQNVKYINKNNENAFVLGPLSFKIKENDITFITGGNGSGKTAIKTLTGLYSNQGKLFYKIMKS